jgi:hypothetical protein
MSIRHCDPVDAPKSCVLRPLDPCSDEEQLQAMQHIVLSVMPPEGVVFAFRYVRTYRNTAQDGPSLSINPGRETTPFPGRKLSCPAYCCFKHILTVKMATSFQALKSQYVSTRNILRRLLSKVSNQASDLTSTLLYLASL